KSSSFSARDGLLIMWKDNMITYPLANRRRCYWLVRDCLKGHETPCKPSKCADYVSVARAKRERDAKERKRIEQMARRALTR
ncbi:MAG: hypothetical protein Q7R39_14790, partial [Dehalococcoidia bacterium]|nr:hypothetical protein [Dehalococcoidia bacterium]